ncbi:MAG: four helix bundle suffix domain-containing protein [Paludibacteraceae bacterium]|nr:four helix bundle suffix domain-containing protein [Paludibacteraceae bacterium]
MPNSNGQHTFLRKQTHWEDLYFYQKANTLYRLTFRFTERFLHKGDRTIDQMVQAARSGKQNIVEGAADGVTSMEMEVKLLNCARGSLKELREDYQDYLGARQLPIWTAGHPRYDAMLTYCRKHNQVEDYEPYFDVWDDVEMANVALSLCHITDKLMTAYQNQLEKRFVEEGGIRERMTAARLGYRTDQKEQIETLRNENAALRDQLKKLQEKLKQQGIKL